jgi:hypothetical protein
MSGSCVKLAAADAEPDSPPGFEGRLHEGSRRTFGEVDLHGPPHNRLRAKLEGREIMKITIKKVEVVETTCSANS